MSHMSYDYLKLFSLFVDDIVINKTYFFIILINW